MVFCREVMAFELYEYKPGSEERGPCIDRIAESLNSIEEPWCKVDQRSLKDRIKKLLKYAEKRNKEMRASVVEEEHTRLDDLLLDIYEREQQTEAEATEASEANNKKFDQKKDRNEKKVDGYQWSVYQKLIREEVIAMMILM